MKKFIICSAAIASLTLEVVGFATLQKSPNQLSQR